MARILAVDDDRFTLHLLAEMLRALGHDVTTALDARQGLQALAAAPHDIVISDVRMPGWDGIELARRIGLMPKSPPVILTSADADFEVHEEALRRGIRPAAFVQKPFDRPSIARALRGLAGGTSLPPNAAASPSPPGLPVSRDEHPEWLARARGSASQLAPVRMWFVAGRRQASGAIVLKGTATTTVGLKRGEIVEVTGMPGLGAAGLAPADTLAGALGAAMASGQTLDAALANVATDIATWLMNARTGEVSWNADWAPGADAFPLPGAVPRLLGLAIGRVPEEVLGRDWAALGGSKVMRRTPDDVPPDRWGLDPQALRAHRLASGQAVQALVYELSGGVVKQRVSALRSLDLLRRLNLVTLQA